MNAEDPVITFKKNMESLSKTDSRLSGTCTIRIRDMFNVLPPYMDYLASRGA